MTLSEWIKANATLKEGAKIAEFDALAADLDPLKNIKTKEAAADFIDRNGFFKSALDSAISKAVVSHDEKFTAEKLPEILKTETEKIRAELNPEETPEQKRLRELEDRLKQSDRLISDNELKLKLREKAKELGYNGDADRFVAYGDKALDYLENDKKYIDSLIDTTKKEFYKDNPIPTKTKTDPDKTITREAYNALSPIGQHEFIVKNSGVVTD